MTAQEDFRERLAEFLHEELVGPSTDDETIEDSPRQRYSAGVLFPRNQEIDETADEDARKEESTGDTGTATVVDTGESPRHAEQKPRSGGHEDSPDASYDMTIRLANAYYPAAMGLSFVVEHGAELIFEPRAATYRVIEQTAATQMPPLGVGETSPPNTSQSKAPWVARRWKRVACNIAPVPLLNINRGDPLRPLDHDLGNDLKLRVVVRHRQNDSLITAVVYNSKPASRTGPPPATDCFFQVGLRVRDQHGRAVFSEYRSKASISEDPEERSLSLLYRNRRSFAVGHGCATDWNRCDGPRTTLVETASLPRVKVPPIEPTDGSGDEYSMHVLSGLAGALSGEELGSLLQPVAREYGGWIAARRAERSDITDDLLSTADAHLALCDACQNRIQDGIDLLMTNETVREAFTLTNRVMLMQQLHYRRKRRAVNDAWEPLPTNYAPLNSRTGRWRKFQLAFLLMNLRSMLPGATDVPSSNRNVVDLIWFPTGGGKTEAYLGLSAYTILIRRLIDPTSDGCTVLMRYTLRLLTSQQFQRASSMISACELLRRAEPERLGQSPVSIGLWVGQSLTPNNREDANKDLSAWVLGRGENKFQILNCPWCGTEMDNKTLPGYRYVRSERTVRFVCPCNQCPFGTTPTCLPISVIDDDIYESPPSLIIGTVDKFAMLAWREKAGAIFGLGSVPRSPPDLIIQDELHLIAGPLGSMTGLYEAIIDRLCMRTSGRPKIVASTATIRRAEEQCKRLYCRRTTVFPPAGLSADDNYFSLLQQSSAGRLYVGAFGSAAPSFVTLQIRAVAALLFGSKWLDSEPGQGESIRDPYWTTIWYFNTLRELGNSCTLIEADIPEYLKVLARRYSVDWRNMRHLGPPIEMTSRRSAEEIPVILQQLAVSYPDPRCLDTLLATNMISVGVDVDRLGLMAITAQPKTTSEYIQASSRVGRSSNAPGLIAVMYAHGNPRDRSHYEHFRSYHEAFYRFVEPTSVTPFSLPAQERAIHALLVIAVRHICGIHSPDLLNVDSSVLVDTINWLVDRCRQIDPDHVTTLQSNIARLLEHWRLVNPSEWGNFNEAPDDVRRLMYPAGSLPSDHERDIAWSTPSSLRSVDSDCACKVLSRYPSPTEGGQL